MSNFTILEKSRLGAKPRCTACRAGAILSFNWTHAQDHGAPEDRERIALFSHWKSLRRGSLYRCRVCQEVWHLDGDVHCMTHVENERLQLVLDWDREPIELSADLKSQLRRIGATPPDIYGNGKERRVTPCAVNTIAGEKFDIAMVCVQPDAPVQDNMHFRLGSEINEIYESPFALPLAVREASGRAEEIRMGFSPCLIEMPDGKRFVLNGMTSFLVEGSYRASDAAARQSRALPHIWCRLSVCGTYELLRDWHRSIS